MPVDKFGRMSDAKPGIPEYRSLILITIIFVATALLRFPVL